MELQEKTISRRIDELEAAMMELPKVDCPLEHHFTNGLYSRTIYMPAGVTIVSMIHKTQHQYVISKGIAHVKINENEWQELAAPFIGVTEPGTRRILYIENDCVWTTFHPVDIVPTDDTEEAILKAVSEVETLIIEPHLNEILGGELKNNELLKVVKDV